MCVLIYEFVLCVDSYHCLSLSYKRLADAGGERSISSSSSHSFSVSTVRGWINYLKTGKNLFSVITSTS